MKPLTIQISSFFLALFLLGCQPADTYETHFAQCMEGVEITKFNIEGSDQIGFGYRGFDAQCIIGAPLPLFTAKDLEGKTITTDGLKGKINVFNFWFTKCAPCVKEIPALNELVEKFGQQDVNFIAVTKDTGIEIDSFLQEQPFHFQHITDADLLIYDTFHYRWGYPSTLITDRDNKIIALFKGLRSKQPQSQLSTQLIDNVLTDLVKK